MNRLDEFSSEEILILINECLHDAVLLNCHVIETQNEIFSEEVDGYAYQRRLKIRDTLTLWETQLRNALVTVQKRERMYNT